jgi:amino acid transporter
MNSLYYFLSTLILFVSEALLAAVVTDVTSVFDFVAAFSVTCVGFLFPAIFYLTAVKKFRNSDKESEDKGMKVLAFVHLGLGLIVFVACIFSNCYTIWQSKE